jgi:hypothetical protein
VLLPLSEVLLLIKVSAEAFEDIKDMHTDNKKIANSVLFVFKILSI